jgi:L-threonylcarbamoyladenylate synthase
VKTEVLAPTAESIARAAAALRGGAIVGLPTETVYGLAASAFDPAALASVFAAKARPTFDPLIVHVVLGPGPAPGPATVQLERQGLIDGARLTPAARAAADALAAALWPGPLTLVLPRAAKVPDLVTAGLDGIGLRAPSHPVARALIAQAGPLAAPSANRFGRISPTTAAAVVAELDGLVPLILDGGPCEVGVESTVVRVEPDGRLLLLRPGGVSPERLAALSGRPVLRGATPRAPGTGLASPGTLESHYAPRQPLLLLDAPLSERLVLPRALTSARSVALLARDDDPAPAAALLAAASGAPPVVALGLGPDPAVAARRLFAALRDLEASGAELLVAEPPAGEDGLWHAIKDRLRRASAPR